MRLKFFLVACFIYIANCAAQDRKQLGFIFLVDDEVPRAPLYHCTFQVSDSLRKMDLSYSVGKLSFYDKDYEYISHLPSTSEIQLRIEYERNFTSERYPANKKQTYWIKVEAKFLRESYLILKIKEHKKVMRKFYTEITFQTPSQEQIILRPVK